MNYKLEKFWNLLKSIPASKFNLMNYKLEKFWNTASSTFKSLAISWTINLKSFEITKMVYYKKIKEDEL